MYSLILAAALAVAPTDVAPPPPPDIPPPPAEQVLAIPPELRARLPAWVRAPGRPEQQRLQRLVNFLFAPEPAGLGMSYQHDGTHTVEQAWRTRRANCLGFTLLVVALAREAGFDAHGQEIDKAFSWSQQGDTIFQYNHINAGIRAGQDRYTVDVASDSVIATRPPKRIPDSRLLAIYYSNRAVELLAAGRRDLASAYIATSLQQDAGHASTWNNAGVIRMREGDMHRAERDYVHALRLDPEHGAALANLHALYLHIGDRARAGQYARRIERLRLRDPYHHFMRAQDYEKRGEYQQAIRQYRSAIKLLGSEHRFHFGLARAYLLAGQSARAGDALRRAHALSNGAARNRYQAKLEALRRQYGN